MQVGDLKPGLSACMHFFAGIVSFGPYGMKTYQAF